MSVEEEEFVVRPDWLQRLVERIEEQVSFFSVGQLEVRWTENWEFYIAPAMFQVESDDEQHGETGFGAFEVPDVNALASLLTSEGGGPGTVSCGPTEDDRVAALVIEGSFQDRRVWLGIQFEPFEDAEPLLILNPVDEEHEDSEAEGNRESH